MPRLQFPQGGNHVCAKMAVLPRVDPQFEESVAREGSRACPAYLLSPFTFMVMKVVVSPRLIRSAMLRPFGTLLSN